MDSGRLARSQPISRQRRSITDTFNVLGLLREKHARGGNGGFGEYAFLTHVRDAAWFDAKRTIDAIAVSLWPSRGRTIDAFEVKVSRSDWQRDLADPKKAEAACGTAERFWIVAPSGVVRGVERGTGTASTRS